MDTLFYIILLAGIILLYAYIKLKLRKKPHKGYGIKTEANDGTILDSKQEKQVADYFDKEKITWNHGETISVSYTKYEILSKITFGLIQPKAEKENIKTDFIIPYENEKIYIEYFGMINVKGKTGKQYRKRHKQKLKLYEIGQLKLVSLYPEDLDGIDKIFPKKLKEETGIKLNAIKKFQKEIIFCNECGNQLPKNSKFCDNCGNEFKN